MKKILLTSLTIFFMAVFLMGCNPQNTTPTQQEKPKETNSEEQGQSKQPNTALQTVEPEQEFVLSPGQEAQLKGTELHIYFQDVESDSRCPSDVACVTAGTVNISVKASKAGKTIANSPFTLVIGGYKDIDTDYSLKFVKIEPERGKQYQEISKADYRATFVIEPKTKPLPVPVTEVNNPSGVIFPKESLPASGPQHFEGVGIKTTGLWNPSVDEAKKADQIVKNCMADKEKIVDEKIKNYPKEKQASEKEFYLKILQKIDPLYADYIRQYVGYTAENEHKLVWINYFLPEDAKNYDWKNEIVRPPMTTIRSDYHGYFNVLVDLNDESCLYFSLGI